MRPGSYSSIKYLRKRQQLNAVLTCVHLGYFTQKCKFCYHLLTLLSFQTCITSHLFHTAIPENTQKMCPVICPGLVWFWFIHTASDFTESVRALTHNPVKTRDISWDVYNAPCTVSLNWWTISASAQIVRNSLISASFQFIHFIVVNINLPSKHPVKESHDNATAFMALVLAFVHRARSGTEPGNVTRSPIFREQRAVWKEIYFLPLYVKDQLWHPWS